MLNKCHMRMALLPFSGSLFHITVWACLEQAALHPPLAISVDRRMLMLAKISGCKCLFFLSQGFGKRHRFKTFFRACGIGRAVPSGIGSAATILHGTTEHAQKARFYPRFAICRSGNPCFRLACSASCRVKMLSFAPILQSHCSGTDHFWPS